MTMFDVTFTYEYMKMHELIDGTIELICFRCLKLIESEPFIQGKSHDKGKFSENLLEIEINPNQSLTF